ncbi:trypsin-like peptidase domain-containing protein [Chloroflexota bacterium]
MLVKVKRFLLPIVILVLLIATGCGGGPSYSPTPAEIPIATPVIEDIVDMVSIAVVRIMTQEAVGSGMIIDGDGYILTNNHIVQDVQSVRVILMDGGEFPGTVVERDEDKDLAIVEISISGFNLPAVTLGDSETLKAGEDVIAIGYPFGLEGKATVSKGIISAFRTGEGVHYIQTDASINPGNSGGPLINSKGEVIGIATFKIVREEVEGMGFAIVINDAKSFIADWKAGKRKSETTTPSPAPAPVPTPTPAPTPPQQTSAAEVKDGDTVKVNYTGTLEDGTVFDTSLEREPMEFTLGQGQLIPDFEQAVIGMKVGESKTVTIPAERAYGPYINELIMVIDREDLPEGLNPEVGQRLGAKGTDGKDRTFTVLDVSDTSITLDANHPLAGKDLTFEIELVEIQ